MRKIILLVVTALTLVCTDVRAEDETGADHVSVVDVMAMMALVPVQGLLGKRPSEWRPAGFEKSKDAPEIALAISQKAPNRVWASRLVVFGAYESGFKRDARGDGNRAFGWLQLQHTAPWIAFDPSRAIDAWMVKAQYSLDHCGTLAAVASGNCEHGVALVRGREEIARTIAMLAQGEGE